MRKWGVEMRKLPSSIALVFAICVLPTILQALCMVGFVCDVTVSHWHLPLSIVVTLLLLKIFTDVKTWLRVGVGVLSVLLVSVFLAELPVMFSIADGDAYHRTAVFLLSDGWNPLRLTEEPQVAALAKGFRTWHVAFLPRGTWLFGAALHRWTGAVEVADAYNFFAVAAMAIAIWRWVGRCLSGCGRLLRGLVAAALCLSPSVACGMVGGGNDAVLYSFLLVSIVALIEYCETDDWRYLMVLSAALVPLAGVKYTGCVAAAVAMGALCLWRIVKMAFNHAPRYLPMREFVAACLVGIVILLANATPYLTSMKNHASPFFPAHTFDKTVKLKDHITFDFDIKNADSAAMGYVGRFAYAYLSKSLTKAYYRWKLGQETFEPKIIWLFKDVDGYGVIHRVLFVLALVGWFFLPSKGIRLATAFILLTVLLTPAKFMGYARYVPQVYAFPLLVGIGLLSRFPCGRVLFACVSVGYCSALSLLDATKLYPYAWLTSVQNLQLWNLAREADRCVVESRSANGRMIWSHDSTLPVVVRDSSQCKEQKLEHPEMKPYMSCSKRYVCWLPKETSGEFYDYAFGEFGDDLKDSSSRRAGVEKFFLKTFLPNEPRCFFRRIRQWLVLRGRQIMFVGCCDKARSDVKAK